MCKKDISPPPFLSMPNVVTLCLSLWRFCCFRFIFKKMDHWPRLQDVLSGCDFLCGLRAALAAVSSAYDLQRLICDVSGLGMGRIFRSITKLYLTKSQWLDYSFNIAYSEISVTFLKASVRLTASCSDLSWLSARKLESCWRTIPEGPTCLSYETPDPTQPSSNCAGAGARYRGHCDDAVFVFFSRCGRLVYHLSLPLSILEFPYVEQAIKIAYCEEKCGNCSLTVFSSMIFTGRKEEIFKELSK